MKIEHVKWRGCPGGIKCHACQSRARGGTHRAKAGYSRATRRAVRVTLNMSASYSE